MAERSRTGRPQASPLRASISSPGGERACALTGPAWLLPTNFPPHSAPPVSQRTDGELTAGIRAPAI
jgi:hypothetical protein